MLKNAMSIIGTVSAGVQYKYRLLNKYKLLCDVSFGSYACEYRLLYAINNKLSRTVNIGSYIL
jgi:hypothetical protein